MLIGLISVLIAILALIALRVEREMVKLREERDDAVRKRSEAERNLQLIQEEIVAIADEWLADPNLDEATRNRVERFEMWGKCTIKHYGDVLQYVFDVDWLP